jgi:hypothetical protein
MHFIFKSKKVVLEKKALEEKNCCTFLVLILIPQYFINIELEKYFYL